jgi:hypothetical protein
MGITAYNFECHLRAVHAFGMANELEHNEGSLKRFAKLSEGFSFHIVRADCLRRPILSLRQVLYEI